MNEPNLDAMSSEEVWRYYLGKYETKNPIARLLLDRFFASVGGLLARLSPSDRVLEVGCGPGASTLRLRELLDGRYLEASEYDERNVAEMQKRGFPVPVRQESVYELQRQDGEFDCVVMLEVLEHLEDVDRALRELFRVSRKYVLVSAPNEPLWRALNMLRGEYLSSWGNTPGHIHHWSPFAFRRLVSSHGRVVTMRCPIPWTIVLAEKR